MKPDTENSKMMMNTTLNQLRSLRLETMAQALEQQLTQSGISAMSFEERLALLVDREVHGRQDRRCARLLKTAKLKYPQAAIEDLDSRSTRGLERSAVMSLALGEWVKCGHAVLITGATGAGKSWLACAPPYVRLVVAPPVNTESPPRSALYDKNLSFHPISGTSPEQSARARPTQRPRRRQ